MLREHPRDPRRLVIANSREECDQIVRLESGVGAIALLCVFDVTYELRPAREAVLAGDGELCGGRAWGIRQT
jgi:hypothetical protein